MEKQKRGESHGMIGLLGYVYNGGITLGSSLRLILTLLGNVTTGDSIVFE